MIALTFSASGFVPFSFSVYTRGIVLLPWQKRICSVLRASCTRLNARTAVSGVLDVLLRLQRRLGSIGRYVVDVGVTEVKTYQGSVCEPLNHPRGAV